MFRKSRMARGQTAPYIAYAIPLGHPNTACVCGRCNKPGVIWLTASEVKAYNKGQRIFKGPNNFVKMQVDVQGLKEE
jgi:hypothetical protein